jgi:hypothetical protein
MNRLFRGLSFPEYVAIDAAHASTLKAIDVSLKHYAHAIRHARADTTAFVIGRVLHAMILDPAPPAVAVYEGKVRRGKDWEAFEAEHAGETILKRDELADVAAMRAAVLAHPRSAALFAEGEGEVSMVWEQHGIKCKGRLDWLRPDGSWVELKTTEAIKPARFARQAGHYLYHAQVAFYAGGLAEITGEESPAPPHLVTVEKKPPYDVAVYTVEGDAIEAGQRKVDGWLRKLAEARRTGQWPGVAPDVLRLELPDYVLTDGLEDVDLSGIEGDDE